MSVGTIILLAVAAVLLAAIIFFVMTKTRSDRRGLRRRFGPEYDRTVDVHDGDTKAAERELDGRLRRHGDFHPLPLASDARRAYSSRWDAVQERFVDEPLRAVVQADALISALARERGYPADGYREQVDALSIHHAHTVHGYREAHEVAAHAHEDRGAADASAAAQTGARTGANAGTEHLRETLVHARALFEELLRTAPEQSTGRYRRRGSRHGTSGGTGRLGKRLHLPGGGRGGHRPGHAARSANTPGTAQGGAR